MTDQRSPDQLVAELAEQLGETRPQPTAQIRRIVEVLGADTALAALHDTQQIEAQGGQLTASGKRRRTPGGIFFQLVRERTPRPLRKQIFLKNKGTGHPQRRRPAQKLPPETLPEALRELADRFGPATTTKVLVTGRPGQPQQRGDIVVVGLTGGPPPSLPKGLPAPPQTKYVVLIARKQWLKVADALAQPDDRLIVEGYPAYDTRHAGITVYAINVSTRAIQQARRQQQNPPGG